MNTKYTTDVSVKLTIFFLKLVGLWLATSRLEECFRNFLVFYTVVAALFCIWVQAMGLYFIWGDFTLCTDVACNTLAMIMGLVKILLVFVHKKKFLWLIVYMQKNFWHSNYSQQEKLIIVNSKRVCIYFVCIFSFFSQTTAVCYFLRPAISNIGRNASDRVLIFNMWLDLPLSTTPYYEITYVIQVLSLYQADVCYLCFDNIFCIMCLHVAGQFRLLQYRITNLHSAKDKKNDDDSLASYSTKCFVALKDCIRQHQDLIEFCATLEETFRTIILVEVLIFSALICFAGYQAILADLVLSMRISFICFLASNMCQLWMFTYSCDCLTRESVNVAPAAYAAPWINLPMDEFGKMVRKDLQLVIVRSRRACTLTACGFFPISLETYTKIMSTAMSYFTLLKQRTVDTVDA